MWTAWAKLATQQQYLQIIMYDITIIVSSHDKLKLDSSKATMPFESKDHFFFKRLVVIVYCREP